MDRDVHTDVVQPAFPVPMAASPSRQDDLKTGFWETAVACDKPEPGEIPSLDSCHRSFLGAHKVVN